MKGNVVEPVQKANLIRGHVNRHIYLKGRDFDSALRQPGRPRWAQVSLEQAQKRTASWRKWGHSGLEIEDQPVGKGGMTICSSLKGNQRTESLVACPNDAWYS